ncbi:MAG: NUDIX hydrolase [Comamonas sp.]|nr:NUDIX hydrolase [Comamonas sp.]
MSLLPTPETPRSAATIVLVRDSDEGLQTLLLRRSAQLANMAGMFVFPGGKLEHSDSDAGSLALLDQPADMLRRQLGEADADTALATGLHVAALREALEECGMLLAEPVRAGAALDAPRARHLLGDGLRFDEVLSLLGLRMATRALVPWSRWITPVTPSVATRRFDARFFMARAPAHQQALHDNEETTASLWCTPRAALEHYRDGTMDLAPPQIMSLAHLTRYATAGEALTAARGRRPPTIQPETFTEEEQQVVCYPGDARHTIHDRALPGPTRLYRQGRRFLPPEGFDALFG